MTTRGWRAPARHRPAAGWRLALLLMLALVLAALPFSSAALAADAVGTVLIARGAASVVRGDRRLQLIPGAPLFAADMVLTGEDGRVRLRLADGTVIALGSNGQLALADVGDRARTARAQGLVELVLGIIRAVVAPAGPAAGLAVETRTAVASSRSTEWMLEATAASTAVVVLEGSVAVRPRDPALGGGVLLRPGEGTDVRAGQAPTAPVRWGEPRRRAFEERTRVE